MGVTRIVHVFYIVWDGEERGRKPLSDGKSFSDFLENYQKILGILGSSRPSSAAVSTWGGGARGWQGGQKRGNEGRK